MEGGSLWYALNSYGSRPSLTMPDGWSISGSTSKSYRYSIGSVAWSMDTESISTATMIGCGGFRTSSSASSSTGYLRTLTINEGVAASGSYSTRHGNVFPSGTWEGLFIVTGSTSNAEYQYGVSGGIVVNGVMVITSNTSASPATCSYTFTPSETITGTVTETSSTGTSLSIAPLYATKQ